MYKLQTKFAVVFLGSAFLIFMVWDRSSKKSELEVGPIEDHVQYQPDRTYESHRVLHRSKRRAVDNQLGIVYRQFYNVRGCCAVPALITSDALEACEGTVNARRGRKNKKQPSVKLQQGGTWFDAITNLFPMQTRSASVVRQGNKKGSKIVKSGVRKNSQNKNRGKRDEPQKITLSSVCYTACVFDYLNFMNDSAMDLNRIEETFTGRMKKEDWKKIVQDAMYTCEEPSACASPEMVPVGGRYCSIKPTIMMNCMRKQMILNCPDANRRRDYLCNSRIASLKSLNTFNMG